jgi:tetratricopeptide (TPR) repeat protein
MIQLAILEKDHAQADAMFKHLSEAYPGLPLLSAQFGNRVWADYRSQVIEKPNESTALDSRRQLAQTYLERAVKSAASDNLAYDTALASRNLVDIYLSKGELDLALQALESAEVAPLDLVKQKHAVIMNRPTADLFVRDTYRLALKVYLATMKRDTNPQTAIEKMKGVLAAMRQNVDTGQRPEDRTQLSQIYSLIANELLNQFEAKPDAEKGQFAGMLMGFLNSIEQDSKDAETILWAGSTALKVAGSLNQIGLANESKPMFAQAISALNRAEELGFEADPQRRAALLLELKRQRGLAMRGNHEFEEAVNQLCEILDDSPQNVKVQIDAAETLQLWGISIKRSRLLAEAIKGTRKKLNPQTKRESNQIWGWEFLARATRGKNDDLFCTAIYHWAECLLENGLIEKNQKTIGTAWLLIETEEKRTNSLSAPDWKPRFEKLKERIRKNRS